MCDLGMEVALLKFFDANRWQFQCSLMLDPFYVDLQSELFFLCLLLCFVLFSFGEVRFRIPRSSPLSWGCLVGDLGLDTIGLFVSFSHIPFLNPFSSFLQLQKFNRILPLLHSTMTSIQLTTCSLPFCLFLGFLSQQQKEMIENLKYAIGVGGSGISCDTLLC